jgi:hypothetical protein
MTGVKSKLHRKTFHLVAAALVVCVAGSLSAAENPASQQPAKPASNIDFETHIAPILAEHCFACHGTDAVKSGLDLRRRFSIVDGGDSGAAIVPGEPDESLLVEMIVEGLMPPEEEPPLQAEQITLIKRWVSLGAPIRGEKELPLEADAAEEISEEDRAFWSFQPPVRPSVPQVEHASRVRNALDAFLLAKLEKIGASFNPEAEKRVLVRRLYFDLLGLPPTPQEADELCADGHEDAYERLVDRLLASRRYGERWARHWLDAVGYAESDGYLDADRLRPEAWRYRDYIIRALNDDKPYDRFLLEQVAGDELADWRRAEALTDPMKDNLVATGFLRTAVDGTYDEYKEKDVCHKVMADTIEIVSSTLLGLSVQCARCHAHKFDPLSSRDYYSFNAIFLASYDPEAWVVSPERSIPLATDAQASAAERHNQQVDARCQELETELAGCLTRYREQLLDAELPPLWEQTKGDVDPSTKAEVRAALLIGNPKKRTDEQNRLVAKYAPKVATDDKTLTKRFPTLKQEAGKLHRKLKKQRQLRKSVVKLRGLLDLDTKPRQAHILRRGDWNSPGAPVGPNVPAVLSRSGFVFEPAQVERSSGRRLAFAKWLIDRQNPLTARLHVNRMWAHHFGQGIVATLGDFGSMGSRPTHPELLDWLATEFIRRGYSQKAMHRLMLTSTAYRQASQPNKEQLAADPDNLLLGAWRPHRHEGEVLRDSALYVAGRLNPQMFGKPVPVDAKSDGLVVVADTPAGNRRSVYLIVRRSQPVTLLNLFDTPVMEVNCTLRNESTVVTQALTLMNSEFTEAISGSLADRLLRQAPDERSARIELVYRLLLTRTPREAERASLQRFLDGVLQDQLGSDWKTKEGEARQAAERFAWRELSRVLLNCNEFLYVN